MDLRCNTVALPQETLRAEFSDRTLLAVAHRLHTIIEADRVLVMERGRAVEYGPPAALLEDDGGHFTGKLIWFVLCVVGCVFLFGEVGTTCRPAGGRWWTLHR